MRWSTGAGFAGAGGNGYSDGGVDGGGAANRGGRSCTTDGAAGAAACVSAAATKQSAVGCVHIVFAYDLGYCFGSQKWRFRTS